MADTTWLASTAAKASAAPLDGTEVIRVIDGVASKKATIADIATFALRTKVVTFSRDLSTASGSQSVTGVGFTPKAIAFIGGLSAGGNPGSFGLVAGDGSSGSVSSYSGGSSISNSTALTAFVSGGNVQTGTIASFDAGGFTISWTKTGSPTGTVVFYALCFG